MDSVGGDVWALLTPEALLEDSPFFRSSLQHVEDELDSAGRWLDSFVKNLRTALDLSMKLTDFLSSLEGNLNTLQDLQFISTDNKRLATAANSVSTVLSNTELILIKLIRKLEKRMVGPLLQNMLESVRELKEARKIYERLVERYDGYLARPDRAKEPSIREETYLSETLEYIGRLRQFRSTFELGLLEKVSVGMGGFGEFCWALGQVFQTLHPDIDRMPKLTMEWQEAEAKRLASLKKAPQRPNGLSLMEMIKDGRKSGHLYKKGSRGLKGAWKRVYAQLDGNHYFVMTCPGRIRGTVQLVARLNVLLCEVRPAESQDRKFCFEIYTSHKSWILCTPDGDDEVRRWIQALEAAKEIAVKAGTVPDSVTGLDNNNDEDDQDAFELQPEVNTNPAVISTGIDYVLARENRQLHAIIPSLSEAELVLVSFYGLVRTGPERYLSGNVMVTSLSIYISPISLLEPEGGCRAICLPFREVKAIEAVITGDHLFAQCDLILQSPSAPEFTGLQKIGLLSIEERAFEIISRLYRNSLLQNPASCHDLLADLGLADREQIAANTSGVDGSVSPLGEDSSEVPCECEKHLEVVEVNIVLPVSVDSLYDLIFGSDAASGTIAGTFKTLKYSDPDFGPWIEQTSDSSIRLERDVSYTIPVNNPLVKAKDTRCYEHNVQMVVEPGRRYIVDTDARTPMVPFGETFITQSRFCLTRANRGSQERSRLVMSVGMKWLKSPLVKSIIRDATLKGFGRYCAAFVNALRDEIGKIKPELKIDSIIEVEPKKAHTGPKEPNMVFQLFSLIGHSVGRLLGRYPIVSLALLLLALLHFSAFMTARLYISLFRHPKHVLVDVQYPTRHGHVIPANIDWSTPSMAESFKDISDREKALRDIGDDLVQLAQSLQTLQDHLGTAKYATWLADRLSQCYRSHTNDSRACKSLEKIWAQIH